MKPKSPTVGGFRNSKQKKITISPTVPTVPKLLIIWQLLGQAHILVDP